MKKLAFIIAVIFFPVLMLGASKCEQDSCCSACSTSAEPSHKKELKLAKPADNDDEESDTSSQQVGTACDNGDKFLNGFVAEMAEFQKKCMRLTQDLLQETSTNLKKQGLVHGNYDYDKVSVDTDADAHIIKVKLPATVKEDQINVKIEQKGGQLGTLTIKAGKPEHVAKDERNNGSVYYKESHASQMISKSYANGMSYTSTLQDGVLTVIVRFTERVRDDGYEMQLVDDKNTENNKKPEKLLVIKLQRKDASAGKVLKFKSKKDK